MTWRPSGSIEPGGFCSIFSSFQCSYPGVFFVICVSVSWKILALDLVNLECLSGELFGDNHPVTPAWLVSAPEEKKSGGAEGRGGKLFWVFAGDDGWAD